MSFSSQSLIHLMRKLTLSQKGNWCLFIHLDGRWTSSMNIKRRMECLV